MPLGSLMDVQRINGPDTVGHCNVYPTALIQGATLPGVSSGQAIEKMERIRRENLPSQFSFEWTRYGEQSRSPPHRKICVVGPGPSKKPIFGGICSLLGDFRHPKLPRCDADNPLEVKAELTLVRETGSYRHVC